MKWYASKKILVLVLALFSVATFSGYLIIHSILFTEDKEYTYVEEDGTVIKRINVLLLGVDARPGEKKSRTDTMIVASIDPETDQVTVISIPRDTRVNIPKRGYAKINSANVYGGIELTEKTVEDLLGIPIHYHVLTNFEGFKEIVDTLGGVELDVEKDMYYTAEGIKLKKGLQRLNGDQALQYVRFRSDALGDIGRTQRQQNFLKAIAKEMLQIKTLTKIPKLWPQISRTVETNLQLADIVKLANIAKKLESNNLVSQTLPGNFYNKNGVSYWAVDEVKVKEFIKQLLVKGATTNYLDESIVNKDSVTVKVDPSESDANEDRSTSTQNSSLNNTQNTSTNNNQNTTPNNNQDATSDDSETISNDNTNPQSPIPSPQEPVGDDSTDSVVDTVY